MEAILKNITRTVFKLKDEQIDMDFEYDVSDVAIGLFVKFTKDDIQYIEATRAVEVLPYDNIWKEYKCASLSCAEPAEKAIEIEAEFYKAVSYRLVLRSTTSEILKFHDVEGGFSEMIKALEGYVRSLQEEGFEYIFKATRAGLPCFFWWRETMENRTEILFKHRIATKTDIPITSLEYVEPKECFVTWEEKMNQPKPPNRHIFDENTLPVCNHARIAKKMIERYRQGIFIRICDQGYVKDAIHFRLDMSTIFIYNLEEFPNSCKAETLLIEQFPKLVFYDNRLIFASGYLFSRGFYLLFKEGINKAKHSALELKPIKLEIVSISDK